MVIKNGYVLGDDFKFVKSDIEFGVRISAITENANGEDTFDASECYVVPGFVDTHIHSSAGRSFAECKDDAYEAISKIQSIHGTTSVCMTLSAADKASLINVASSAVRAIENPCGYAKYVGIHFEGPFVSGGTGACQKDGNIARIPTVEEFDEYYNASKGYMKIMTIAPEVPGCEAVIKHGATKGVAMSIGHTVADCKTAKQGFEWGITRATHTYNAMTGLHHRNPGVVGAILTSPDIDAELICDFFHVAPEVVKLTFDVKGADRITVVTDAEIGAGMPDGRYFGSSGRYLNVKDGKTYTDDGTICGGTSFLIENVKNLVSVGIPLEDAFKTVSINPARAVKMEKEIGSLAVGKLADIVVLDKNLDIVKVFINGNEIAL